MIAVDKINHTGFCHMVSDSLPELHAFAEKIGVKRCWFSNRRGKSQPHYDLKPYQRQAAINAGAKFDLSREDFVKLYRICKN